MKNLKLAVLMGILTLIGISQPAFAIPMFARMYSYNCSTCHYPGYGQLNKFGYNFRAAGYRIPADIGKDMNDGKVDMTNYISARYSGGASATTKTNANKSATPDNASFTLGGASIFIGGGVSKNFFAYSELGLGNGTNIFSGTSPNLNNAKIGYVSGTEEGFLTVRVGKFSADGFGGSDRGPVGNATIAGTVKPTGTGLELGYTCHDTRITLGFFDGIQNPQFTNLDNGTAATANVQAPTSDSNNAKDIQLFVNQFIGDDGLAVNAVFYNGFNASVGSTTAKGGTGDAVGQEYYNTALFISSPVVKDLDVKVGGLLGQTNSGVFASTGTVGPTTGGFFGELDYTMDEITPLVFRYDYTSSNLNVLYTDTQKFTLGALTPFVQNVYQNPSITLTRADQGAVGYNDTYVISDNLNIFF